MGTGVVGANVPPPQSYSQRIDPLEDVGLAYARRFERLRRVRRVSTSSGELREECSVPCSMCGRL